MITPGLGLGKQTVNWLNELLDRLIVVLIINQWCV